MRLRFLRFDVNPNLCTGYETLYGDTTGEERNEEKGEKGKRGGKTLSEWLVAKPQWLTLIFTGGLWLFEGHGWNESCGLQFPLVHSFRSFTSSHPTCFPAILSRFHGRRGVSTRNLVQSSHPFFDADLSYYQGNDEERLVFFNDNTSGSIDRDNTGAVSVGR